MPPCMKTISTAGRLMAALVEEMDVFLRLSTSVLQHRSFQCSCRLLFIIVGVDLLVRDSKHNFSVILLPAMAQSVPYNGASQAVLLVNAGSNPPSSLCSSPALAQRKSWLSLA
eukprot:TRINITY_DN7672_c0_g1_i1.p2 TRINITY_DN7672_c0_g1~~TRINITY_DN7672_c0_g1_i1.p2  ORF type:complete len:113 (-),score=17.61 TRINITY_DN7672_c0_g1_i1:750-1088(-)